MFDIHSVTIENFRSFRGKHVIELPARKGLYLLTGQNLVEPRLEANGCGKSTLLDAIYWCLYGKTTRGLKASDILTWGEKTCSVAVHLTVGEKSFQVCRAQSPNKLEVDQTTTDQQALQKLLRLGPEAFTYAVMLPQFGDAFFDLLPSAKLTLFSEIMELDYWLEKSKAAEDLAAEIAGAKSANEREEARLKGQLEVYDKDIEYLKSRDKEFNATQTAQISKVMAEIDDHDSAITFTEKALKNVLTKLPKNESKCQTCGQPVPNKDREALLHNQSDFERQLRHLQMARTGAEKELKYLKQENPYDPQIASKEENKRKAQARTRHLVSERNALEADHAAVAFWIQGFKRIRLFIVEQTLRQLEIEINNNMSSLGLNDWRIAFDVERENKSGGVTKGFTLFVYPPGQAESIKWEAFSGGESQRLRLAGNLGLANLIMERAGLRNTIEFFDEPSRHIGQQGLLDVAETLDARADADQKRIILVDHATFDFGGFADRLVIEKGRDGSRLLGRGTVPTSQ